MLKLKSIYKSFDRPILEDINITFPKKGIYFIKGESGCGKTTLINIIAGFIKQDKGSIYFDNDLIINVDEFRREKISFVFQDYGIIDNFSIKDNLLISEVCKEKQSTDIEMVNALNKVNLFKDLNEQCINLSGGEKQRVALARVLLNHKEILILDEPSSSLDKENINNVFTILKDLSKTTLIIIVSHNNEVIQQYGDFVYDLDKRLILKEKEFKNISLHRDYKSSSINVKTLFNLELNSIKLRKVRYIVSVISCALVMVFSLLGFIFQISFDNRVDEIHLMYLDYNKLQVSCQEINEIDDSNISLISQSRPNYFDLNNELKNYNCQIVYNIDYLFLNSKILINNNEISCLIKPIYYLDDMDYNEVFVNESMYKLLNNKIELEFKTSFITYDNMNRYAIDVLYFFEELTVKSIAKEFDFMSVPTIYYSYNSWVKLLNTKIMANASTLLNNQVTFYDRFSTLSENDEDVSSYCFDVYLFDENIKDIKCHLENSKYYVTSSALEITANFSDIFSSIKLVLLFFIIISLIILFFLISIIMYSFVLDRKKEIGLLLTFGVNRLYINLLFLLDASLLTSAGWFISFLLINSLRDIVNDLIFNLVNISAYLIEPEINFYFISYLMAILFGIISSIVPNVIIYNLNVKQLMEEK